MGEKKKVWIIDLVIPEDSRREDQELEKITKNQDLKIEMEKLWHKFVTLKKCGSPSGYGHVGYHINIGQHLENVPGQNFHLLIAERHTAWINILLFHT